MEAGVIAHKIIALMAEDHSGNDKPRSVYAPPANSPAESGGEPFFVSDRAGSIKQKWTIRSWHIVAFFLPTILCVGIPLLLGGSGSGDAWMGAAFLGLVAAGICCVVVGIALGLASSRHAPAGFVLLRVFLLTLGGAAVNLVLSYAGCSLVIR